MGGLFVLGVVLTLMGMAIMAGLTHVTITLTGSLHDDWWHPVASVAGEALMRFRDVASKFAGIGLLRWASRSQLWV